MGRGDNGGVWQVKPLASIRALLPTVTAPRNLLRAFDRSMAAGVWVHLTGVSSVINPLLSGTPVNH